MKKFMVITLALVLCLLSTACGTHDKPSLPEEKVDKENSRLESLAADYLVLFCEDAYKSPHSVEIYNVWALLENNKYYFTVELSTENSYGGRVEETRGNGEMWGLNEDPTTWKTNTVYFLLDAEHAKKNGMKVNSDNVQAYYDERI